MEIIEHTIRFVKEQLKNAEGGHDWFHIERVYKNALLIAEGEDCDVTVVKLGALLHDIADSKFHNGDETVGPKTARTFLEAQNVTEETILNTSLQLLKIFRLKAEILNNNFVQKNWKLCKMQIDWMRLEPLVLPEHLTTADSKTERYIIQKLLRNFPNLKKNIKK